METGNRLRSQVQREVDELAHSLARAVTVDDEFFRTIAHQVPSGDADPLRIHALVERVIPFEALELAEARGLFTASGPTRIDPVAGLVDDPRTITPIHMRGQVCAFLAVSEKRGPLLEGEIQRLVKAAVRIGDLFLAEGDVTSRQLSAAFAEALEAPAARRVRLLDGLLAQAGISDRSSHVVACLRTAVPPLEDDSPPELERWLGVALFGEPSRIIAAAQAGEIVALMPAIGSPKQTLERFVRPLAERVRAPRICAGISTPFKALEDFDVAWARARGVARVALAHSDDQVLSPDQVTGLDELLASCLDGVTSPGQLAPAHARLLEHKDGQVLASTLRAYLDTGADIKATSELLRLHRSGVYYRLNRIEQIAGIDLKDGDDRLMMHLSLRLADLLVR